MRQCDGDSKLKCRKRQEEVVTVKKREVKPFIEKDKRELIVKLSFLTGVSIQTIGEDLLQYAIDSDFAIFQSQYFKYNIKIKKLQFPAQDNPPPLPANNKDVERISFRIGSGIYEYAHSLSYALGITVPKVIARMIHFSMNSTDFLNDYVLGYLSRQIGEERKELLISLMGDLNGRAQKNHTVAALLFCIADEMKEVDNSMPDSVNTFVSQWTAAQ